MRPGVGTNRRAENQRASDNTEGDISRSKQNRKKIKKSTSAAITPATSAMQGGTRNHPRMPETIIYTIPGYKRGTGGAQGVGREETGKLFKKNLGLNKTTSDKSMVAVQQRTKWSIKRKTYSIKRFIMEGGKQLPVIGANSH